MPRKIEFESTFFFKLFFVVTFFSETSTFFFIDIFPYPTGSMGLAYLPTFTTHSNQPLTIKNQPFMQVNIQSSHGSVMGQPPPEIWKVPWWCDGTPPASLTKCLGSHRQCAVESPLPIGGGSGAVRMSCTVSWHQLGKCFG